MLQLTVGELSALPSDFKEHLERVNSASTKGTMEHSAVEPSVTTKGESEHHESLKSRIKENLKVSRTLIWIQLRCRLEVSILPCFV